VNAIGISFLVNRTVSTAVVSSLRNLSNCRTRIIIIRIHSVALNPDGDEEDKQLGHSYNVVLGLLRNNNLLGKGYTVYTDS
jgi:hypothetical protein